jgi:cytoskeleton protein RodZ
LPSFGEKLKQEREKRKMSLEQISATTKIGTRMLQALEEDKFNQLPGGIFNKGFVRAYSHCLGLDEDQTVAEYLEASGDAPPPRTEIPAREDEARENEEHLRRLEAGGDSSLHRMPWGWFAALLLVIAVLLSLWNHRQREHEKHLQPAAPTTTGAQLPTSQVPGAGSGGGIASETASAAMPRTASAATTDIANPAMANSDVGSQVISAASSKGLTRAGLTAAVAPDEFTVVIHAREECWFETMADGKALPSELLPAGSERTVRGRKEVVVKAGNAGGIDFRFNGKKIETGAQYGQVKTVAFGPTGLLPAPPSTP